MAAEYKEPSYPVVNFLIANGIWLSVVLALGVFACGLALAWCGWGVMTAVVGAVAAVVVGVLLTSYVEVLRIIADTLIPR